MITNPEEHAKGLAAARRVAGYELGDASWADMIVAAYLSQSSDGHDGG